jgi:epoxyqueuosine reductase
LWDGKFLSILQQKTQTSLLYKTYLIMNLLQRNSGLIKKTAARLGFDFCGIAKAERLQEDAKRLETWLKNDMHGTMKYMERHFELRVDPSKLVPGAKSVITLLKNYYNDAQQSSESPRISKYALGKDYHLVIRNQLNELLSELRDEWGEIQGRGFVDSAPVLERTWAQKSGLGWIGKNGNLINKQNGSFYFIATLITDIELAYDDPFVHDFCGTCTKCIDACPTDAILADRVVDGSKCISYFTIELKDALIPGEWKGKFQDWAFGCDTCQDVCPWNRFSHSNNEKEFVPISEILNLSTREWESLTESEFKKIFHESALSRTALKGMTRNLQFLKPAN